jgi:predicted lipid-binding transport protein (Tim44 family)
MKREENRPVRLEGLVRLIGAIVLGVAMGLISFLVFDSVTGSQAASVMAVLIFIVTAGAFSWAFR